MMLQTIPNCGNISIYMKNQGRNFVIRSAHDVAKIQEKLPAEEAERLAEVFARENAQLLENVNIQEQGYILVLVYQSYLSHQRHRHLDGRWRKRKMAV